MFWEQNLPLSTIRHSIEEALPNPTKSVKYIGLLAKKYRGKPEVIAARLKTTAARLKTTTKWCMLHSTVTGGMRDAGAPATGPDIGDQPVWAGWDFGLGQQLRR